MESGLAKQNNASLNSDYSWVFRHERQKNNKIRCCPCILSAAIAKAIERTKIGVSA